MTAPAEPREHSPAVSKRSPSPPAPPAPAPVVPQPPAPPAPAPRSAAHPSAHQHADGHSVGCSGPRTITMAYVEL